jgi:NRAMP (natural resistance-associated macrophage protein)-like metal ion transporter
LEDAAAIAALWSDVRIGHRGGSPVKRRAKNTNPTKANKSTQRVGNGFFATLGPGLITGASDDDPSGIGTYSQAGAQLGFSMGWTMLLTFPLMAAIQEISARIGRTTGHGIAGNLRRHYPNWLLQIIILPLFLANTINIGADLSGMADAARLLLGGPAFLYVLAFGLICVLGVVFVEYSRYVMVLKWLTLSLFAYVGTLFGANVPWPKAISGLLPQFNWNTAFLTTLVAILGTTISPYLFFWQASQEAEDVKTEKRRKPLLRAPWQAVNEFTRIRTDTLVGMAFSNLICPLDHDHDSSDPQPSRH